MIVTKKSPPVEIAIVHGLYRYIDVAATYTMACVKPLSHGQHQFGSNADQDGVRGAISLLAAFAFAQGEARREGDDERRYRGGISVKDVARESLI